MTGRARLRAGLVVLLVLLVTVGQAAASPGALTVSVDRTTVRATLGRTFLIRSTITNHGAAPASGLIAHLDVLSLGRGLYVDPEDWSSRRTRYLAPIPAGSSTTSTWQLHAVNAGRLGVYVAVLPRRETPTAPITASTVSVTVAGRRTLSSGGILPLALGIPAALGLLALSSRLVRCRPRRSASSSRKGARS